MSTLIKPPCCNPGDKPVLLNQAATKTTTEHNISGEQCAATETKKSRSVFDFLDEKYLYIFAAYSKNNFLEYQLVEASMHNSNALYRNFVKGYKRSNDIILQQRQVTTTDAQLIQQLADFQGEDDLLVANTADEFWEHICSISDRIVSRA